LVFPRLFSAYTTSVWQIPQYTGKKKQLYKSNDRDAPKVLIRTLDYCTIITVHTTHGEIDSHIPYNESDTMYCALVQYTNKNSPKQYYNHTVCIDINSLYSMIVVYTVYTVL
jgi:hypothetical protein